MNPNIADTAEIFKALGDETRLKIIKIIAAKGNTLCVGAISSCLNITQPAVSQHLKILKNSGLVEAVRHGSFVHYSLALDSLTPYGIDLQSFLESFGAEFILDTHCELKGQQDKCKELN